MFLYLQASKDLPSTAANGAEHPANSVPKRAVHVDRSTPQGLVSDAKLQQTYVEMASRFLTEGIDVDAITDARKYFTGVDHLRHGQEARLYSKLEEGGLATNAVRLLVLPLDDAPVMSSVGVLLTQACYGVINSFVMRSIVDATFHGSVTVVLQPLYAKRYNLGAC
jgi:hypothetical protein